MPRPMITLFGQKTLSALGRLLLRRARGPAQRVAEQALSRLSRHWPLLAELLDGYVHPRAQSAGGGGADEGVHAPVDEPVSAGEADTGEEGSTAVGVAHLHALVGAADFQARAHAARALAGFRELPVTEALAAALRDPSVEVAIAATGALGDHGGDLARNALRAVVENAEGYYAALVRAAAVRALSRLSDARDEALLYAAMRDVDAEVSVSAIAALAERDGEKSAAPLLGLLQDRSQFFLPVTRLSAARALGRIPKLDRGAIASALRGEPDGDVRKALEQAAKADGQSASPSTDA